jgi:hypothetical protein
MYPRCRYISEDFGGAALHPVDIMDAGTGRLLTQLVDANLATICPVNKPHPRLPLIVSGSSRSLYAWRPAAAGLCRGPFACCLAPSAACKRRAALP